jgi:hypothetical protein
MSADNDKKQEGATPVFEKAVVTAYETGKSYSTYGNGDVVFAFVGNDTVMVDPRTGALIRDHS